MFFDLQIFASSKTEKALTFIVLFLITFAFQTWYYLERCKWKGKKWGRVFKASIWSPLFAFILSFAFTFIPMLKLPLLAFGFLGDIIHPFFSKVPEGLTYIPGYLIGIIFTTLFGSSLMKC